MSSGNEPNSPTTWKKGTGTGNSPLKAHWLRKRYIRGQRIRKNNKHDWNNWKINKQIKNNNSNGIKNNNNISFTNTNTQFNNNNNGLKNTYNRLNNNRFKYTSNNLFNTNGFHNANNRFNNNRNRFWNNNFKNRSVGGLWGKHPFFRGRGPGRMESEVEEGEIRESEILSDLSEDDEEDKTKIKPTRKRRSSQPESTSTKKRHSSDGRQKSTSPKRSRRWSKDSAGHSRQKRLSVSSSRHKRSQSKDSSKYVDNISVTITRSPSPSKDDRKLPSKNKSRVTSSQIKRAKQRFKKHDSYPSTNTHKKSPVTSINAHIKSSSRHSRRVFSATALEVSVSNIISDAVDDTLRKRARLLSSNNSIITITPVASTLKSYLPNTEAVSDGESEVEVVSIVDKSMKQAEIIVLDSTSSSESENETDQKKEKKKLDNTQESVVTSEQHPVVTEEKQEVAPRYTTRSEMIMEQLNQLNVSPERITDDELEQLELRKEALKTLVRGYTGFSNNVATKTLLSRSSNSAASNQEDENETSSSGVFSSMTTNEQIDDVFQLTENSNEIIETSSTVVDANENEKENDLDYEAALLREKLLNDMAKKKSINVEVPKKSPPDSSRPGRNANNNNLVHSASSSRRNSNSPSTRKSYSQAVVRHSPIQRNNSDLTTTLQNIPSPIARIIDRNKILHSAISAGESLRGMSFLKSATKPSTSTGVSHHQESVNGNVPSLLAQERLPSPTSFSFSPMPAIMPATTNLDESFKVSVTSNGDTRTVSCITNHISPPSLMSIPQPRRIIEAMDTEIPISRFMSPTSPLPLNYTNSYQEQVFSVRLSDSPISPLAVVQSRVQNRLANLTTTGPITPIAQQQTSVLLPRDPFRITRTVVNPQATALRYNRPPVHHHNSKNGSTGSFAKKKYSSIVIPLRDGDESTDEEEENARISDKSKNLPESFHSSLDKFLKTVRESSVNQARLASEAANSVPSSTITSSSANTVDSPKNSPRNQQEEMAKISTLTNGTCASPLSICIPSPRINAILNDRSQIQSPISPRISPSPQSSAISSPKTVIIMNSHLLPAHLAEGPQISITSNSVVPIQERAFPSIPLTVNQPAASKTASISELNTNQVKTTTTAVVVPAKLLPNKTAIKPIIQSETVGPKKVTQKPKVTGTTIVKVKNPQATTTAQSISNAAIQKDSDKLPVINAVLTPSTLAVNSTEKLSALPQIAGSSSSQAPVIDKLPAVKLTGAELAKQQLQKRQELHLREKLLKATLTRNEENLKLSMKEREVLNMRQSANKLLTTAIEKISKHEEREKQCMQLQSQVEKIRQQLEAVEKSLKAAKEETNNIHDEAAKAVEVAFKTRTKAVELAKTCRTFGRQVSGENYKLPITGAAEMLLKMKDIYKRTVNVPNIKRGGFQIKEVEKQINAAWKSTSKAAPTTNNVPKVVAQVQEDATFIRFKSSSPSRSIRNSNLTDEELWIKLKAGGLTRYLRSSQGTDNGQSSKEQENWTNYYRINKVLEKEKLRFDTFKPYKSILTGIGDDYRSGGIENFNDTICMDSIHGTCQTPSCKLQHLQKDPKV